MLRRALMTASVAVMLARSQQGPAKKPGGLSALHESSTFARIPAGTFRMGYAKGLDDEGPEHEVRISTAFEIAKTEVTQAQWDAVVRDPHNQSGEQPPVNPAEGNISPAPSHFLGPDLPVESVSWDDVQVFLRLLNSREGAYRFRLPTEAEWEYASRADSKAAPALKDAADEAWFKDNSGNATHAVGMKKPNKFGLFDMDGNVAEWVSDWYGADYYAGSPHSDPKGPSTGSYRVFKGGAWLTDATLCRPTIRNFDFPNSRFYHVGFRLVRVAK